MTDIEEKVIMTPKCKTANSTTLVVERKAVEPEASDKIHVAGGDHTGIIINKEKVYENGVTEPCHAQLEFYVYLVSGTTGTHTREARALRFWFKPQMPPSERPYEAQAFFRELVSPQDFPKDYVGFIKKIMKLMQHKYYQLKLLEVELRQEGCGPPPPAYIEDSIVNQTPVISEQRVLDMIENAYPNALTVEDFVSAGKWSKAEVKDALEALEEKGLTRTMSEGLYIRQHSIDTQVVKQMPTLCSSRQPSIAVITALYCEKQAVDAMMDNQETYVRYTTVGESNVYTLGTIGAHRVVTTKLPSVGRTREAMTAAGNTTTRLLGIFQKVEYVFLVGVGGGVPHYTDYAKHVRLGDVVVSTPAPDLPDKYVYVFCEKAEKNSKGGWDYEVKPYKPANFLLQEIAIRLANTKAHWDSYVEEGLRRLRGVPGRWEAPASGTDRLCVDVGHGAYIEVSHPAPQPDQLDAAGALRVHCAPVAGGRAVAGAGDARAAFAAHARARAYDCELDAVLDSVVGNRKDCFLSVRGISDYRDGTRGKEWQPRAALCAAAVMKAIVAAMDPPTD
ncbi:hypothetical protein O3G_MSEX006840 [Manduca sexta]|uniref:Winged helix-turn-helix domain-containing protein n=1 Tax=Manduca sexta TaxID=7130 RepID=A0A922CL02_MANSE|nr:hypothetical protein O3G_MSEX006840 [Manduca sexta]KAG6450889.1 hypothetical protein O3G_MSEX006840 [Manduca sexta]KAG6450890.1 hypothetical protein O3G_MSEX006840 [Manduca sexta]